MLTLNKWEIHIELEWDAVASLSKEAIEHQIGNLFNNEVSQRRVEARKIDTIPNYHQRYIGKCEE